MQFDAFVGKAAIGFAAKIEQGKDAYVVCSVEVFPQLRLPIHMTPEQAAELRAELDRSLLFLESHSELRPVQGTSEVPTHQPHPSGKNASNRKGNRGKR